MTLLFNQLFLHIHKKMFLLTLLTLQLVALTDSPNVAAQSSNQANYPNKQIQFIVPFHQVFLPMSKRVLLVKN